jgi:ankyrin repeat protein
MMGNGMTAVHYAILHYHEEILTFLLDEGGLDANEARASDDITYSQFVCMRGKSDVVIYFMKECRVNVDATQTDRWTALHLASRNGHLSIVQCLLEEGNADRNVATQSG